MIRRLFEQAVYDPNVFFDSLDDGVEWEAGPIEPPDYQASVRRGPAAVREFFRRWLAPFDEWGAELGETIDVGDSVVAHVHQWGRGKGSGALVEQSHWQAWTFRDGKIVRVSLHGGRGDALEAVGARE